MLEQDISPRWIVDTDGQLRPLCMNGHRYAVCQFNTPGGREYDLICERCGDARTVVPART